MPPPGSAATSLHMNQNSLAGRTGNSNSIWAHLLLFLKEGAHLQVRTVSMAQARPRHLFPTRCGLKRGPVGAQFTTNSINLCQINFVLWCKRSHSSQSFPKPLWVTLIPHNNCYAHTLYERKHLQRKCTHSKKAADSSTH